ncbi:MAG: CBS domain-containing protein [Candidatus Fonsibacter ubiquis]|nr:CBS domain-containing protein [Candidatus Fonsibacter ubiquis]
MSEDYLYVDISTSIGEAIKNLQKQKKSVILVKEKNKLSGIITEQDIVRKVTFISDSNKKVSEIMTSPVIFVYEDDLLFHAVGKMRKSNLRHLPVIDLKSKVVGIIHANKALYALNNVIFRRSIRIAERRVSQKNIIKNIPDYTVLVMGSGGRMESFLYPDQDNGIIYEPSDKEDPKKVDLYFEELAKDFTKSLDDAGIPFCKGNLMATNPMWRKSLPEWKNQVQSWVETLSEQNLIYVDMLYDFRSVYGNPELANELRDFIFDKLINKKILKFLFKNEENRQAGLTFFGNFVLEKKDPENKGLLNLKGAGTLPLIEAVRIYSIKNRVNKSNTLARIEELNNLKIFDDHEKDFIINAHRFLTYLLLKNQVASVKAGKPAKNFINPKLLLDREKGLLKVYLRKINELKTRARAEISEEYF